MRIPIRIPQAGTATEAVFLEWAVAKGQRVVKDQVLGTAETDKAVIEIVAERDGVLDEMIVQKGQEVSLDQPVGFLLTEADSGMQGVRPGAQVPLPVCPAVINSDEEVQDLSPIRRRIAENLEWVAANTARASTSIEIDYGHIAELREQLREKFLALHGFRLTFLPFIARAACIALPLFPDVTAAMDLVKNTWVVRRRVNLGIAVARKNGLLVPVLKDAHQLSLTELAIAMQSLAAKAREGRLAPEESQGGTFTLTNPGSFGSIFSQPLVNRGETAILSIDAIERRPVVVGKAIAIGRRGYATLAFDHRILDGGTAIDFLNKIREILQTGHLDEEAKISVRR